MHGLKYSYANQIRGDTIKTEAIFILALMALMVLSCTSKNIATKVTSPPNASITMTPYRVTYDLSEVPLGAVRFTASIRNEGTTTMTIAHPSICFPA
jgi:hypothetical protein